MYQSLKKLGPTDIKRLVLVVDDDEINREMLGMMLSDEYSVKYAKDGEEALELIKRHSRLLSLILLDLLMPVKSGTELLRAKEKVDYAPLVNEIIEKKNALAAL